MKESIYKSYDELPLFLNSELVAKVLGVSPSSGYELMHQPNFPVLRVGSSMVVPKKSLFSGWRRIREVQDEVHGQLFLSAKRDLSPGPEPWRVGGVLLSAPVRKSKDAPVLAQLQDHRGGSRYVRKHREPACEKAGGAWAHRCGAYQGYDQSRRDTQRDFAVHSAAASECNRPTLRGKAGGTGTDNRAAAGARTPGAAKQKPPVSPV